MKQPIEADFNIQVRDAEVQITFRPMMSHYSFPLLPDRRVSPRVSVRHANTGDRGEYAWVMSKLWHFALPVQLSKVSKALRALNKK